MKDENNEKTKYKMIRVTEDVFDELDTIKAMLFDRSWDKFFKENVIPKMRDEALNMLFDYYLPLAKVEWLKSGKTEESFERLAVSMLRDWMRPDYEISSKYNIHPAVED